MCSFNDIDTHAYASKRVNAPLEAMRRRHKHQIRKAAGVTKKMVGAVMATYAGECADGSRHQRARHGHWELATGAAIALGCKLLPRYDDLKRCRWDAGYCEVFPTHIRFFLDGRKNN